MKDAANLAIALWLQSTAPAGRVAELGSFAMSGALILAGALTLVVSLCAAFGVWLFGIRPCLQRHGVTVATGATLMVGAWADWQQCRDFARANSDAGASRWSKLFLLTQIGIGVGIVLMICRI